MVSTTVIDHLTKRPENRLVIVSRTYDTAAEKVRKYSRSPEQTTVVELDVEQAADEHHAQTRARLEDLIAQSDIVISLVPYTYHVLLAKICIAKRVNMVTTSYISPEMYALHEQAREAGVILMNEIGVDPGTDHLSAVKIIEETKRAGGRIEHFYSWCGGLPAPEVLEREENRLNPLKYKFSWSAVGALRALSNSARYKENDEVVSISPEDLMTDGCRSLGRSLSPDMEFEGYPNRDSLPFLQHYGIEDAKTILRGTLRYKGFCETIVQLRKIGVLDFTARPELKKSGLTWASVMQRLLSAGDSSEESLSRALLERLGMENAASEVAQKMLEGYRWMELFSDKPLYANASNYAEALAMLFKEKMDYLPGERDMTFLQHTFKIVTAAGEHQTIKSTLELYGDEDGKFSSMAKGTGLPCAVATQMILDGKLTRTGVWGPYYYDDNIAMLDELAKVGVAFREEVLQNE